MHIYLKGYYGRQNLGDEILLLGVLRYLRDHQHITDITLEAGDDIIRMQNRLTDHHQRTQGLNLSIVSRPNLWRQIQNTLRSLLGTFPFLVLGGGEVVCTIHPFPHNGRNYLMMYAGNIRRGRYAILGGITLRNNHDALGQRLISNAQYLTLRDEGSYAHAQRFSSRATLYQDFAIQVIDYYLSNGLPAQHQPTKPYILVNLHPSKTDDEHIQRLLAFIAQHPGHDVYYVPCDINHDHTPYRILKSDCINLIRYDWTRNKIPHILAMFAGCKAGMGARLHFLLLLQQLDRPFTPIIYQEKVTKVLGL